MIIRTTFHDTVLAHSLDNYWNRFFFINYKNHIKSNYSNNKDAKMYQTLTIEAEDLLEKAMFHEKDMTKEEKDRFLEIIKESILNYIRLTVTDLDYKPKLDISLVDVIEDKIENNEVVYYMLSTKNKVIL